MPYLNRCIWTAASSGLGSFVVSAAAQNGYTPAQCLAPAVVDGLTYHYFATNSTEHEEGDGVYTVATNTLTRATIRNSSTGSKVNFTAAPTVTMGGPISTDMGPNPLVLRQTHLAPWDDFDAADDTLLSGRIMPSGHAWGVTGVATATAKITKQGYVNVGVSYAFVTDAQDITEIECVVSWLAVAAQSGDSGTDGTMAFTSDPSNPISATSKLLHLQFHPEGWNLLKSTAGPAGLTTLTGTPVELNSVPAVLGSWYGANLRHDGTRYKIRMVASASANTLTIYFPDGTVWQWTDTDISTIMTGAKTAFWEHAGNGAVAGEADLYFNGCDMGPSKAGSVIEANTCKNTTMLGGVFAETGFTSGNGGYQFRRINAQQFTATGNGYYTIATESADTASVKMAGIVTVRGRDSAGRKAFLRIYTGVEDSIPAPYHEFNVEGFLGQYGGGLVDLVRISQNNTTHHIQLDLHVNSPNANGATFQIDYEGYFTVVASPVSGASALATWSQEAFSSTYWAYQPMKGVSARVQDLPPASQTPIGSRGFVTNSNATLAAGIGNVAASGGANLVPVYNDGTNWRIG
jgi:hypothetical protein